MSRARRIRAPRERRRSRAPSPTGADPRLLIVFASSGHDLERSSSDRAVDVPLVGCTTAGEIATDGPGDHGVVVMALGGDGFAISTAVATDVSDPPARGRRGGRQRSLDTLEDRPHKALLLLTDGLAGDQQDIVRGAYDVAGSVVPLVGGCAGDDLAMAGDAPAATTTQVLRDAVVGVAIGSDAPLGIGVQHGWRRASAIPCSSPAPPATASTSSTTGPRSTSTSSASARPPRPGRPGRVHPLRPHPPARPRPPQRRGPRPLRRRGRLRATAALGCIAEVPQGAIAWFMDGDAESVLSATDDGLRGRDLGARRRARPRACSPSTASRRRGVLGDDGIAERGRADRRGVRRRARSRASTPTARSPAPAASAASTTRRSSSWRSREPDAVQLGRAAAHRVPDGARRLRGRRVRAAHRASTAPPRPSTPRPAGRAARTARRSRASAPAARRPRSARRCDARTQARALAREEPFTSRRPRCCAAWPARSPRRSARWSSCSSLRGRQELLERLAQIQRTIVQRHDLDTLLNSIVAGAAELIGDEVVSLRLRRRGRSDRQPARRDDRHQRAEPRDRVQPPRR